MISVIFYSRLKGNGWMVAKGIKNCPICGGELRYRDKVSRIVRTKYRKTKWIKIRRLKCCNCGVLHRECPEFIFPYKQYETELIKGVIDGLINSDTFGFEDYPCETTMRRWQSQNLQVVL